MRGWRLGLLRRLSFYPPFLGAGIRVRAVGAGFRVVDVTLRLRWWNRNAFGTQFGGSLYMMVDPFYCLILAYALGRDYVVWDQAATIRFLKPGRTDVKARFEIPEARIAEIRAAADAGETVRPTLPVSVTDLSGQEIASVEKVLYVRRKQRR